MTSAKAKVIFATHMQAARMRKLTTYERNQLAEARQVLRSSRKPAMNAPKSRGFAMDKTDKYWYGRGFDDAVSGGSKHSQKAQYLRGYRDGVKYSEDRTKHMKSNPKQPGVLIYEHVDCIYATKGPGHICDAECKKNGHRYFHEFKTRPKMYGLKDGSILIRSK